MSLCGLKRIVGLANKAIKKAYKDAGFETKTVLEKRGKHVRIKTIICKEE